MIVVTTMSIARNKPVNNKTKNQTTMNFLPKRTIIIGIVSVRHADYFSININPFSWNDAGNRKR